MARTAETACLLDTIFSILLIDWHLIKMDLAPFFLRNFFYQLSVVLDQKRAPKFAPPWSYYFSRNWHTDSRR